MNYLKVNDKMMILNKVYEMKSKRDSLKDLKHSYKEDI